MIISGNSILFSLCKPVFDYGLQHCQIILFSSQVKLLKDPLAFGECIK